MCSVKLSRVALVAAAAGALAAAAGACGGDNSFPSPDDLGAGGAGGFGGNAGSDLAPAAGDGSVDSVSLLSPTPLSSLVPTSTNFQLQAMLADVTPTDLEPYISIVPHQQTTPLSGAFNWKGSGTIYQINFIPAAVADLTDYVVTVGSPAGATLLKTGVSTGSRPRVTRVELHSDEMGQMIYFLFSFSEPMNLSTLGPAVSASFGSTTVTGSVSPVDTTNANFRFDVSNPAASKTPIDFRIVNGASAATGFALLVLDWDSNTNPSGDQKTFDVSFTPTAPLSTVASATYTFTPTIN